MVYIRVVNPERTSLQANNHRRVVLPLAQMTLRAALGDVELDSTLACRDHVNAHIRRKLNRPTDEWGTRVESIEVHGAKPSKDVKNVMKQQTSAEHRRRAMILEA